MQLTTQRRWSVDLGLGLLLVIATILACQQVWRAGYIWDDDVYVTTNPLITAPDGLWRMWFSTDSPSQYFPLVYTVFRVAHGLWGFAPAGYHWLNILLHAANGVVLWQLLRQLSLPGAWLGAALFLLHPVQVESVAWITELKNVLMGFFFLLTLSCWVRFLAAKQRRLLFYVAALVLYALALFSKTTACTLPAALLLILWLKRERITLGRWLQIAPFVTLAAAMAALTIWWERFHQGTVGAAFRVGIVERLLISSRALWFYLSKLVWPNELCFSYPRWDASPGNPRDYVWFGAILVTIALVLRLRRFTGRSVETAFAYFVATLAPVLGFVMLWTFRYSWVADHYQYLACIGPLALAAGAIDTAALRLGRNRQLYYIIAATLLFALGIRTWRQGAIYQNPETLWRATIACNPRSALAHNSIGVIIGEQNGPIEAELAEYERALESDANDSDAHNNRGFALQRLGRIDEAIAEYEKSIALDPRYTRPHGNLATLLLQTGRTEDAVVHLEKILEMEPRNAALEQSLGNILASLGREAEAKQHWQRARELEKR